MHSFYMKTWSNYSFNCNEMILMDRIFIKYIKVCVKYGIRNIKKYYKYQILISIEIIAACPYINFWKWPSVK